VELVFVFLIAAIGYLIGSIKIKGIELGTAGVLIVALVFGHFGVEIPGFVSTLVSLCLLPRLASSPDLNSSATCEKMPPPMCFLV
jgi:hypothetical protein